MEFFREYRLSNQINNYKILLHYVYVNVESIDFLDTPIKKFDFYVYLLFKLRTIYINRIKDSLLTFRLDNAMFFKLESNYSQHIPNVNLFINHRLEQYETAWNQGSSDKEKNESLSFVLEQFLFKGTDLDSQEMIVQGINETLLMRVNLATKERFIMDGALPRFFNIIRKINSLK